MRGLTHDRTVSMDSTGVVDQFTETPLTGAFFLTVIPGLLGRSVSAAQAFTRGGCLWTHAGISVGNGMVVEADPGGVHLRRSPGKYAGDTILWSDAPVQRHLLTVHQGPPPRYELELRERIADAAVALVGAPYAWMDFLVIAASEWGVPGWQRLRTRVDTGGRFLCSSLVDRAYADAGVHLFTDKRPEGQVTPADLARYDEAWTRERLGDLEIRVREIEEKLA